MHHLSYKKMVNYFMSDNSITIFMVSIHHELYANINYTSGSYTQCMTFWAQHYTFMSDFFWIWFYTDSVIMSSELALAMFLSFQILLPLLDKC